jgi:inhibitor of KinA
MEWRFYGADAVLIRFADLLSDETFKRGRALADDLERHPPPGLIEFVPAFTTLLLEFDTRVQPDLAAVMPELITRLEKVARQSLPPAPVREIPIVYDGPDLERVAKLNQLSVEQVCRRHSEPVYKVYCLGFAPGFPYLGDLHASLRTPRLASPRPRVPAGSVGIGGEHTGIYPIESPAGWNIIGHTPLTLFDPSREDEDQREMFLLKPGDRVKFVRATD